MEKLDVEGLARVLVKHMSPEIVDMLKAQKITGDDFMSLTDEELITFSFPLGYVRTIKRVRKTLLESFQNNVGETANMNSLGSVSVNEELNEGPSGSNHLVESPEMSESYKLLLKHFTKEYLDSLSEYEIKGLLSKAERLIEMKANGIDIPSNPFMGMTPVVNKAGKRKSNILQETVESRRKSARLLVKPSTSTDTRVNQNDSDEDDGNEEDDDANKENEPVTSFKLTVFPKTPDQLKEMSPQLINFDVVKILQDHEKGKKLVPHLQDSWILVESSRKMMYRTLMHHLCFTFMEHPNKVTVAMREGLAKSIVVAFPQYQRPFESEGITPWSSVLKNLNNCMKRIQTKLPETERSRKGKTKVKPKPIPQSDVNIGALAILHADRENKHAILDGMKQTFAHRCNDRGGGMSITELIQKYPHFVNYNGEVISEEFRRMQPNAQDMCSQFLTLVPKISELWGSRVNSAINFNDDTVTACYALALKLPHPIVEVESRRRQRAMLSSEPKLDEIIVTTTPSVDVPLLVSQKRELVNGPIQPYLIGILSPVTKKILKFFLILDNDAVDIGAMPSIRALDLLFKSCFVFNVHYPSSWNLLFRFWQTCLYKIFLNSEDDAPPSCINIYRLLTSSV